MTIVWNNFTYDNKYFVDAINGDDASGDGIKKPFKTLSKLLQVIPKDKNSLIKLEDGEYTFGQDISDGFANCRVTIVGNKAKTTLKQIQGLYSNRGGGSGTFTLEFIQLIFTIDATLTEPNLNLFYFNWNMFNVVIAYIPDNGYSVFLPGGSTILLRNSIRTVYSRNLLRTTDGTIKMSNCYGAFTSGYRTNDNSWNQGNNIITNTPMYDSEYTIPYDEIGVYFGEFAWRKDKFLFKTDKGQYLSFANNSGMVIPQMTSYTTPSGKVEDSGNILTWNGVTYSGWNLFNNYNHWVTVNTTTGWVSYEFETPQKIVQYIITAPSLDANLNRMAKDWEIQAFDVQSNSWVVLDKQSSQTGWKALEKRKYKLNNHNSYKKYKLNVTANNGAASNLQVFRLELLAPNSIDCLTKDEVSARDFEKYGMSLDAAAAYIKDSISKKRLIATKSEVLDAGKTFEHEIDLKKYEVNKISLGMTS
ncbi:hypothetical protein ACE3MS_21180 [Paenibacillus dendritiformis]|uniref:hypothetical protein n=1 Tax=Paenibacillus dendritiformis TaxID=130049 RepID=UPI00364A6199